MEYEKMLKKAKQELPENVEKKKRFKPPTLVAKRSGNNTIIKNFKQAAKQIRRKPKHVAKYLYKKLGTPGYIKGKELHLNSSFHYKAVNKKFQNYIERFVLCHQCGKSDTKLITKGKITVMKCDACGARKTTESI